MSVKLLTEHHLEFLGLKRDCTGSSESIFVKMPHCWNSHVAAQNSFLILYFLLKSVNANQLAFMQAKQFLCFNNNRI